MGVSPVEYFPLPLRAHELLRDVPLHDASVVDLPGGGVGRRVADVRALEAAFVLVYRFPGEALMETRKAVGDAQSGSSARRRSRKRRCGSCCVRASARS